MSSTQLSPPFGQQGSILSQARAVIVESSLLGLFAEVEVEVEVEMEGVLLLRAALAREMMRLYSASAAGAGEFSRSRLSRLSRALALGWWS